VFCHTSGAVRSTGLEPGDLRTAVEKKKSGMCPIGFHQPPVRDTHSVSALWLPERKRKQRLVTQPALNRLIRKETIPRIMRPHDSASGKT
jgi:hypothetical protein